MLAEEDSPRGPLISIPGGTRWIKITAPHPTQVIKVKKSTDLAVFYVQERPGQSQGRVNGTHRSDRQSFLRDYEPYTRRDWVAAQKLIAELEAQKANEEVEEEVIAEPEPRLVISDESREQIEDLSRNIPPGQRDDWVADQIQQAATFEAELASPQSGETDDQPEAVTLEPPMPRRISQTSITDAEQEEIVELWRAREPVNDIATTYNTIPALVWNIVSTRVPDEYRLQRVIDQITRAGGGPIPAYQVSQWMHLGKAQVEQLCTSEEAQKVLRYSIEVRDPTKTWIKTPMVELIQPIEAQPTEPEPIESESEPTMATTAKPATAEAPGVQFVIADAGTTGNNTETPAADPEPSGKARFYRVVVRTTIDDRVLASDISNALDAAKAKYQGRGEVVAVMEE